MSTPFDSPFDSPFEIALAAFQLGKSETFLKLDGIENFHAAQLTLLAQSKRTLYIVTPDFEPDRYNNAVFTDALSAFIRSSRFTDTRILLGNPAIALRWGHYVVKLAQRLTSTLLIRQIHEEDFDPDAAWIVADNIGLLRRDGSAGLKGMLAAKAIPHAQRANDKFIALWERSRDIPDFRNLSL
jgi:hypothetical protein